jgi:hypothetical protein
MHRGHKRAILAGFPEGGRDGGRGQRWRGEHRSEVGQGQKHRVEERAGAGGVSERKGQDRAGRTGMQPQRPCRWPRHRSRSVGRPRRSRSWTRTALSAFPEVRGSAAHFGDGTCGARPNHLPGMKHSFAPGQKERTGNPVRSSRKRRAPRLGPPLHSSRNTPGLTLPETTSCADPGRASALACRPWGRASPSGRFSRP